MIRTVAIIPARGGSKGLPRKNLCKLGGKPLIAWSIEAGLGAARVDATYVSTEDDEIAEIASETGAQVIARPPELASDTAQNDAVLRHALDCINEEGHAPATVVLLQPTSPLRRAEHVDGCLMVYEQTKAVSAMTVCAVDVHPGKTVTINDGMVEPFTNDWDMEARRQDMTPVFRQNGAVYAVRVDDFLAHGRLYRRPCAAYEMDRRDSIDIDELLDLQMAELMLSGAGATT